VQYVTPDAETSTNIRNVILAVVRHYQMTIWYAVDIVAEFLIE